MVDDNKLKSTFLEDMVRNGEHNKQRAFEKSSKDRNEKQLKAKDIRKGKVRKRVFIGAVTIIVAATGVSLYPKYVERSEQEEVTDLFENKYGNKLDDIVHRCSNPKSGSVDYIEVADEIREMAHSEKELEDIIYEFYNTYGRKEGSPVYHRIVDRTLQHIPKEEKEDEFYDGFRDYIKTKGFKDEDQYDEFMRYRVKTDLDNNKNQSKGVK